MSRIAKPLTVILLISIQLSASVLSTYSDANGLRPPAAKPKGGMLDTTFGSYKNGTVITSIGIDVDVVNALVIQPDGKIVVAGKSYNTGSASLDFVVARYTSAGVLDETFGTGGKVTTPIGNANDEIYSIALQPDGKIVVAGSSTNNGFLTLLLYGIPVQGYLILPLVLMQMVKLLLLLVLIMMRSMQWPCSLMARL